MSEALTAGQAPEDPIVTPDPASTAADAPPPQDPSDGEPIDYEAEALAMGWKPPERFKGAKADFIDAKTYVERGKTILPFLRNELKRRDREIEGLKKAVDNSVKHISRADERAYAKAKADLEAELAQYAEAGDKASVKAVTDDLIQLEKDRLDAPKAPADDEPEWFTDWKAENDWFGKDKARSASAAAFAEEAMADGYSGKALAREVDRRLKEEFPHKYAKATNPNRALPGAVEAGGGQRPRGGKSYADLPLEARQMCDEFCRDIKGFTREKFLKDYDWS